MSDDLGGGRRWLDVPVAVRFAALLALGAAVGFTVEPALLGWRRFNGGGVIGGIAGAAASGVVGDPEYRALTADDRRTVRQVQRSAVPSGRAELDMIALRRLTDTAKRERSDKVRLALVAILTGVLPLIASWRMHDMRYLLAMVGVASCIPLGVAVVLNPAASTRRESLQRHMSADGGAQAVSH